MLTARFEQFNSLSSWVDGSQIYDNSERNATFLRTRNFRNGRSALCASIGAKSNERLSVVVVFVIGHALSKCQSLKRRSVSYYHLCTNSVAITYVRGVLYVQVVCESARIRCVTVDVRVICSCRRYLDARACN